MFIQIAGGQNGNLHTYQILLCRPGKISPFPYKSIETPHWNGTEFVSHISECLLELTAKNIIVSCITGDNERAQLHSLDPSSSKSFQVSEAKKSDPNFNLISILYFPCLAHTTDLVLDDAIDHTNFRIIAEARDYLFMFRKFFLDNDVRRIIGRFNYYFSK